MSTPTTATLPNHHSSHFPFSHHQHSSYSQSNTSSYRSANTVLPAPSRLAYQQSPAGYSSSSSHSGTNGITHYSTTAGRPMPHEPATLPPLVDTSQHHAMSAAPQHRAEPPLTRKRRRSEHKTDWNEFYRNGLPKEVIVIDDTPEPEAGTSASWHPQTNGHAASATETRHAAKRQRRDEEPTHYDPVYHNTTSSRTHTSRQLGSPTQSTVSSDRTNSAIHTTAATSLGSLSSTGTYDHDAQPGQKRRRTTRQQVANEAKRREAPTDAFASYVAPPKPPKKAPEVPVKVIHDSARDRGVRCDDDDGHYIVVPDNDLTDKYQMIRLLGQGTFGKVVQARDKRRNKLVAIKIIRSVQKYRDASKIELRVLATLKANDEENRNRCIHLRDCFDYRGHICIVMDLLGQSVFDFLKSNNFVPFPNSQIQHFARQLFTSVAFLHDLNLIHTDLKPENILLCQNDYQTFTYNRKIPSSSSTISRQATQRKVLLDTEIRLIDFGSATFQDEYHSSVVSTRHYRAPEIILGLGWSYPCDIWSIGCILVEFFTGDALFQTHDNLEHLAMMENVVNARIDTTLVSQVNRMIRSGGNPAAKYFKRQKLDYPTPDTTRASRRFVKAMKKLEEIIPTTNPFLTQFLDLLRRIFVYDPNNRITAKEALQHPWFRELAHPDDGTEATRIRREKEQQQQKLQAQAADARLASIRAP